MNKENGKIAEQERNTSVDITATMENLKKILPDIIVYTNPAADACKNDEKSFDPDNNKEQEFHKACENKCCDKSDTESNKNESCKCAEAENEYKNDNTATNKDNEDTKDRHFGPCVMVGELTPHDALLLNIIEGLRCINDNICLMLENGEDQEDKSEAPQQYGVLEAEPIKLCKQKCVSKKKLKKMLKKQKKEITDHIDTKIDSLVRQLFRGEDILKVDSSLLKEKK